MYFREKWGGRKVIKVFYLIILVYILFSYTVIVGYRGGWEIDFLFWFKFVFNKIRVLLVWKWEEWVLGELLVGFVLRYDVFIYFGEEFY